MGKPLTAHQLAALIRAFWAQQGLHPEVWVEQAADGLEFVQSDMINGRPR